MRALPGRCEAIAGAQLLEPSIVDADARIRTAASIPVEAVIVDRTAVPVYQTIAEKAKHLRELGTSDRAIAGPLVSATRQWRRPPPRHR